MISKIDVYVHTYYRYKFSSKSNLKCLCLWNGAIMCFTDGLRTEYNSGPGVQLGVDLSVFLRSHTSVFQLEITAIEQLRNLDVRS